MRWGQIGAEDKSCDYFCPEVDLGIHVDSASRTNTEDPPKEWHKYSGSSLSCASAAGLAAMLLHCALVGGKVSVGDPKWHWLKTARGMRNAFTRIQIEGTENLTSSSQWLPVRRLCGKVVSNVANSGSDASTGLIRDELVKKLLVGMPPEPFTTLHPDATVSITAPPQLSQPRRGTQLEDSDWW